MEVFKKHFRQKIYVFSLDLALVFVVAGKIGSKTAFVIESLEAKQT